MAESTNEPPDKKFVDAETALGGADAVEKTTYVVGASTNPNKTTPVGHPPRVGGTRAGPMVWAVVVLAVVIALVYVLGVAAR